MSQLTPDLEVAWTEEGVDYRLTGRMGPHGPELTGVEIQVTTGEPLSSFQLRAPLLSTFVGAFEMAEGQPRQKPVVHRRGRPRDHLAPRSRLDEVAAVARASQYGRRTADVAGAFGISRGYARQLVSLAKQAGFKTWA